MISTLDIAWAAGFIEGEGNFRFDCSPRVSVCQLEVEPLIKLQRIFGGKITFHEGKQNKLSDKGIHRWDLNAHDSPAVMMTIYVFMSPKRRRQIEEVLAKWKKTIRKRTKFTNICTRGHLIEGENVYEHNGYLKCRKCRLENSAKHNAIISARKRGLNISLYEDKINFYAPKAILGDVEF